MTTVELLTGADIDPFLALAEEEGWICGRWEFDFLLRTFPRGCLVAREGTETLGYVTSVSYGASGWIGNLLVRPGARGRGVGRSLMERAVTGLLSTGTRTVWLTASAKGADLYRKMGFREIDNISRWVGNGRMDGGTGGGEGFAPPDRLTLDLVGIVDLAGWGDRRFSLLQATCERGRLYLGPGGFLACQNWDHGIQIGPWGSLDGTEARELLDQALADTDRPVFLDVPVGNRAAAALLLKRGFSIRGSSTLMYLGDAPSYRPDIVFALASMGSMG